VSGPPVAIVGGGLSGLACGFAFAKAGLPFVLFEASERVGGRVQTDEVEGFRLDRGFQVLLEAYPECRRLLDYDALELRPFEPGALVRRKGRFHRVGDPWRRPSRAVETLAADVGSLGDKLRIAGLRRRAAGLSLEELWSAPETTIRERMREQGFSEQIIGAFLGPLLAGITLDPDLSSSSRMYESVFRALALGRTAIPARGMGEIPAQLASRLPPGSIRAGRRVRLVTADSVVLSDGTRLEASAVVVATEAPETARLVEGFESPGSRVVSCLYFACEGAPVTEPTLILNGTGNGPVNNMCVPSVVSPSLSPGDEALVSTTVLESDADPGWDLTGAVLAQMESWFGAGVRRWRHLRTYRIAHAQPLQPPGALEPPHRSVVSPSGVFVCGDHRDSASIDGALTSGRRAAEAVMISLSKGVAR